MAVVVRQRGMDLREIQVRVLLPDLFRRPALNLLVEHDVHNARTGARNAGNAVIINSDQSVHRDVHWEASRRCQLPGDYKTSRPSGATGTPPLLVVLGAAAWPFPGEMTRITRMNRSSSVVVGWVILGSLTPSRAMNCRTSATCASFIPSVSMCVTSLTCSRSRTSPRVCIRPRNRIVMRSQ